MGVRWLVNAVLLTLPVGGTIGVLSGIDAVRSANGQKSLFADSALEPEMGTSTGPAQNAPAAGPKAPTTVNPKDNRVTIGRYCGRYDKVEPASVGTEYMSKSSLCRRCTTRGAASRGPAPPTLVCGRGTNAG